MVPLKVRLDEEGQNQIELIEKLYAEKAKRDSIIAGLISGFIFFILGLITAKIL